jgi:hypothetical protein
VENGYMKASPGWFFTSVHHLTIEKGKTYNISATMQQQIKELNFVVLSTESFTGQISHIQGIVNGIASQLDIHSGKVTGWPVSVNLDFTKTSDTTFVASIRIPGIIGDTQLLKLQIRFENKNIPEMSNLYELHYLLENFNADKITPETVSVMIVPDTE